jgi:hypothetical protein
MIAFRLIFSKFELQKLIISYILILLLINKFRNLIFRQYFFNRSCLRQFRKFSVYLIQLVLILQPRQLIYILICLQRFPFLLHSPYVLAHRNRIRYSRDRLVTGTLRFIWYLLLILFAIRTILFGIKVSGKISWEFLIRKSTARSVNRFGVIYLVPFMEAVSHYNM